MKGCMVVLALLWTWLPTAAQSLTCASPPVKDLRPNTFYVCHPDQTYWAGDDGWKTLAGGPTIRVPSGKTVVEVHGTNTALFEYRLSSEPVDSPEGKQLNLFLKELGSYLVDVPSTSFGARGLERGEEADRGAEDLKKALEGLNRTIDEVRGKQTQLFGAFAKEGTTELVEAVKAICSSETACRTDFQNLTKELLALYEEIRKHLTTLAAPLESVERKYSRSLRELDRADDAVNAQLLQTGEELEDVSKLIESARKALDEAGTVLELVREIERLALDGLKAKDRWPSAPMPISLEKGRKIVLKVTRKPVAAIASAGFLPNIEATLTLLPEWSIRPAVGLSLLYVEDAVHPVFGTSKTKVTEDGAEVERFRVVEKELEDNRFTYGLTLGLTHRNFCGPEGKSCRWLDFTVNPSDDVQALGVGLSWNWSRFRLGGGALWTKHDELVNGLRLDDLLAAEGDLKTRETYGDPELYLTFSIIGWQPFVSE